MPKKKPAVPAKMGRPPIVLNWEQIEAMAQIQCTETEVASVVGCSIETLRRQSKAKYGLTFVEFLREKGEGGKASLRRAMWQKALAGHTTMLIWLSKNTLGFSDRVESKVDAVVQEVQCIKVGDQLIRF